MGSSTELPTGAALVTLIAMNVPAGAPTPHRILRTINGVRGLAILMVLGVHLVSIGYIHFTQGIAGYLVQIMWMGWTGVDLFFAISGFLITGILLDTRSSTNYFRSFYMRRVLRIFPLYYLAIAITFVLFLLLRGTHYAQYTPDGTRLLALAFYVQNYFTLPLSIGHFWSLALEEQFYLVWPFLLFWVRSRRALAWTILSLFLLGNISRIVMLANHQWHYVVDFQLYWRMDSLLTGSLAALCIRSRLRRPVLRIAPYVAVLSALGFLWICFGSPHEVISRDVNTRVFGFPLLSLLFGSLMLLAWKSEATGNWLDRLLAPRFLQVSGKYSYGLYVFHAPIFFLFCLLINHVGRIVEHPAERMLTGLFAVAVTYGIALLSFHGYERPFLQWKKRFTANRVEKNYSLPPQPE